MYFRFIKLFACFLSDFLQWCRELLQVGDRRAAPVTGAGVRQQCRGKQFSDGRSEEDVGDQSQVQDQVQGQKKGSTSPGQGCDRDPSGLNVAGQ